MIVWVTKPDDTHVPDLETLSEVVRQLDHVSEVDVRTDGSVMDVSFEGGKTEQEEIEDPVRGQATRCSKFRMEKEKDSVGEA